MKKVVLYVIIGVVLVCTGGYFLLLGSSSKDPKFRLDKVSRGNVVVTVRSTGTVNPPLTITIGSQVSGIISKLFVDFNSVVKKGEVIAVIDSTFLYAAVQQAEANVERVQADLNQAQRTLVREKDLFAKSLVSQSDLDAATATYEGDVAQLKQTEAALYQARVNLQYAIIRAPSDGVIIDRAVEVGQTVVSNLQASTLFTLATDLKHMQVEASVDEADIGQIKDNQPVTFTVDAYPDQTFNGIVTQVRLNPIISQNVVTYTVIISVDNPDMKLRPGMTATASILVDRRDNVLRVPTLAIRFQPTPDLIDNSVATDVKTNGGQRNSAAPDQQSGTASDAKAKWHHPDSAGADKQFAKSADDQHPAMRPGRIWVMSSNQTLHPVSVKIGLNDNRYVEISTDSLKEGDDIVVGVTAAELAASSNNQTNPFQQRGPGGGPRRGM